MPLGAFKVALFGAGSGSSDTFIAEVHPNTSESGSADTRFVEGLAVDGSDNVYLAGYSTKSTGGYETWFIKTDALFSDFTIDRVSDSSATEQGNWYCRDLFNTRTAGSSTDQIWWGGQVNNVSPEIPRWCATMKSDLSEETDTFGGFMWYYNTWPFDSSSNYTGAPNQGVVVSSDSYFVAGSSNLYENKQSYQRATFQTLFAKSSTEYAISYGKSFTPGWFQTSYPTGVWLRETGDTTNNFTANDFYFGTQISSYGSNGCQLYRRYGSGHGSEDSHNYYPQTGTIGARFDVTGRGDYLYLQCYNSGDASTHLCKINEFGTSSGDIVWSRETYRDGQNNSGSYETTPIIDSNENVWQTHTYEYVEGSVNRWGTILYRYNSSGTIDRCYDLRQATDITSANNYMSPVQLALNSTEEIIYMAFGAYVDGGGGNNGAYVMAVKTDGSTTGTATLGTGSGPAVEDSTWVLTSDTSYATSSTSDWTKASTSGVSWGSISPNQFSDITATTTAKTGEITLGAF
tara:strand:- start:468 stop:2015 length:1548 start_codon:yes stop_codon:yes gene_type:complete